MMSTQNLTPPPVLADTPKISKIQKSHCPNEVFYTKKYGRSHLKNPPWPRSHWIPPPLTAVVFYGQPLIVKAYLLQQMPI